MVSGRHSYYIYVTGIVTRCCNFAINGANSTIPLSCCTFVVELVIVITIINYNGYGNGSVQSPSPKSPSIPQSPIVPLSRVISNPLICPQCVVYACHDTTNSSSSIFGG